MKKTQFIICLLAISALMTFPAHAFLTENFYPETEAQSTYKYYKQGEPYNGVGSFGEAEAGYFQDGWAVMRKQGGKWHAYSDNWELLEGSEEIRVIKEHFIAEIGKNSANQFIFESGDWKSFFQVLAEIANELGEDTIRNQGGHIANIVIEQQPYGVLFKLYTGSEENLELYSSRKKYRENLLAKTDQLITADLSVDEIAVIINDIIGEICTYDAVDGTTEDTYTSGYDILSGKYTAVCIGYAEAYELLMNRYGVQTSVVKGYLSGRLYHAWNKSLVNGEWRYTDPTLNDTTGTKNWLLLTEEEITKDHIPVRVLPVVDESFQ